MLGQSRQASYLPPTAPRNSGHATNAASTALRLLECNPDSLLDAGRGRRGGRPSAAKLARQRYEEALKANAVQGDLLDFDTPSSTPKGSGSEPLPLVAVPDGPSPPRRQQVSMPPQDGYLGTSSPERTLWPGDLVLAKYSPHNEFYRARVVRVYSSRGLSLADVEWLRQGEDVAGRRDILGSLDGLHWHGLQVGTEVRPIEAAEAHQNSRPESETVKPAEPAQPAPDMVLPDLLDFSPEERPRQPSGGGTTMPPQVLDFAGAGMLGINTSPVRSSALEVGTGAKQIEVAPVKPEERFGFVSDLILQAASEHEMSPRGSAS